VPGFSALHPMLFMSLLHVSDKRGGTTNLGDQNSVAFGLAPHIEVRRGNNYLHPREDIVTRGRVRCPSPNLHLEH